MSSESSPAKDEGLQAPRSCESAGKATPGAASALEQVREEHEQVVSELNRDPVSFTVRSAEGIAMYRGIDSHPDNGELRKLALAGHRHLLEQVMDPQEKARQQDTARPQETPAR